jgi:Zn-dependent protease with chaperone function
VRTSCPTAIHARREPHWSTPDFSCGRTARPGSPRSPSATSSSRLHVEQSQVLPDVPVIRSDQEAASWRKLKQFRKIGTCRQQVRRVPRLEEAVGVTELAGPDVPPRRVTSWGMTQAVNGPRPRAVDQAARSADDGIRGFGRHSRQSAAAQLRRIPAALNSTYQSLCRGRLPRVRHSTRAFSANGTPPANNAPATPRRRSQGQACARSVPWTMTIGGPANTTATPSTPQAHLRGDRRRVGSSLTVPTLQNWLPSLLGTYPTRDAETLAVGPHCRVLQPRGVMVDVCAVKSRRAVNVLVPGLFLMCAVVMAPFRYPALNVAAALVLVQYLVLVSRSGRQPTCPSTTLDVGRARAAVAAVCALAGIGEIPVMMVARSNFAAAVRVVHRTPTVVFAPDYVRELDDAALIAVAAHEISHVVHHDIRRSRLRARLVAAGGALSTIATLVVLPSGLGSLAPAYVLGIYAAALLGWALGWASRRPEHRADAYSVALVGDPEALARALVSATDRGARERERVFGNEVGRFMLLPFSLPPTTHPALPARISQLGPANRAQFQRAQALFGERTDRQPEPHVVRPRSRRTRLVWSFVSLTAVVSAGLGIAVTHSRTQPPVRPTDCELVRALRQMTLPTPTPDDPLLRVQDSFEDAEHAYFLEHDRYTAALVDLAPSFVEPVRYSVVVDRASASELAARIQDRQDPTQQATTEVGAPFDVGCSTTARQ